MSIYTDAADLLEREGWVQKAYRVTEDDLWWTALPGETYDHPGYCMLGALMEADGVDRRSDRDCIFPHVQKYARHLRFGNMKGTEAFSITSAWNDAPERTLAEVVAVLRGEALPHV